MHDEVIVEQAPHTDLAVLTARLYPVIPSNNDGLDKAASTLEPDELMLAAPHPHVIGVGVAVEQPLAAAKCIPP